MEILSKGQELLPVPPLTDKKIKCHSCESVLLVTNEDVIESNYNDEIESFVETKHRLFRADEEWKYTKRGYVYTIRCEACHMLTNTTDHVVTNSEFIGRWQD